MAQGINLDANGGLTAAYNLLKQVIAYTFDLFMRININGIPLLYIWLGFSALAVLVGVLLPVLRSRAMSTGTVEFSQREYRGASVARYPRRQNLPISGYLNSGDD